MTLSKRALMSTPEGEACTQLFRAHRWLRRVQLSLVKIRTQDERRMERRMRRVSLLNVHSMSPGPISPKPSGSYSKNIAPTSDYPLRVTVICQVGRDRECFSGTPYRVFNQVVLFLATGSSGEALQKRSSTDLMKEVALSSYASAILRIRTSMEKSTSNATGSFVRAIHPHEEYARQRAPSPVRESSQPATHDYANYIRDQSTGD